MGGTTREETAMALMLGRLNAALISAGAPEDKAREAAEEVAGYENRLAAVEAKLTLLIWMVGTNVALTVGLYAILLRGGMHP